MDVSMRLPSSLPPVAPESKPEAPAAPATPTATEPAAPRLETVAPAPRQAPVDIHGQLDARAAPQGPLQGSADPFGGAMQSPEEAPPPPAGDDAHLHGAWSVPQQAPAPGAGGPLPSVVSALPLPDPPAVPYTVGAPVPVTHTFGSGSAAAQRYDVNVGGRTIPVFMSSAVEPADGFRHSIDEVARSLASLPPASRALISQVNVDGKRNPQDAFWAQQYHQPGFRSYMTAGADGTVNIYPAVNRQTQHAATASMIHETGHVLSARMWGDWSSSSKWRPWDAASAADSTAASTYARSSRTEDFSETLELYQLVRGTPQEAQYRAAMPNRFQMLDQVLASGRAP
jgi:hypothetical protein